MHDYCRLSDELREGVRKRDAYIKEIQILQMVNSSDKVRESVKMMKGMQLVDMQKASRLLLMAREVSVERSFIEGGLGSAVVATPKLYFFVGCSLEGWRGIVEMIISAMVSMTSGGGVHEVSEDVARLSAVETVRFMEGMQQDGMEKCDHSLLLMKEMEVKACDKSRLILKLSGYVVD
ncbi:hypothetical protein Tco_0649952 [Tanacetum coccineum]